MTLDELFRLNSVFCSFLSRDFQLTTFPWDIFSFPCSFFEFVVDKAWAHNELRGLKYLSLALYVLALLPSKQWLNSMPSHSLI